MLFPLMLLAAVDVYSSETSDGVDWSTLEAVDDSETQTEAGDWKLLNTSTMPTTIAVESTTKPVNGQEFTEVTMSDDDSETQYEQSQSDGLSQVDEGKHMMERFYERYNTTAQVDLVFVLDRSGSVPKKGWRSVVDFVKVGRLLCRVRPVAKQLYNLIKGE